MKYSKEDALKEIRRRAGIIRNNHEKKTTRILTITASLTLIALLGLIGAFSGSKVYATQSEYGAFILSAETGGIMLAAVLGFVLGVVVTLLIKRKTDSYKKQANL